MVYLEHSGSKFWRCEVVGDDGTSVTTTYGKCGTKGRSVSKDFDDEEEAQKYFAKQEASKRKGGYTDAEDPNDEEDDESKNVVTTPQKKNNNKRKKAATTTVTPSPSAKKIGLGGYAAPDLEDGGVNAMSVDSGVAGVDAALASRVTVHEEYHARLALVDASVNSDKYYILQVLIDGNPPKKRKTTRSRRNKGTSSTTGGGEYYLFTRWGRTGTGGQAKLEGPFVEELDATSAFEKIFKSKTGVDWKKAVPGSEPKKGKYEYLASGNKSCSDDDDAQWYYYLQNDPLGKADGWYGYDPENTAEVEDLHGTYVASKKAARLSKRVVTSESSGFQYRVDLASMEQTNTSSGTVRPIGRTIDGKPPTRPPTSALKAPPPTPTATKSAPKVVAAASISAGSVDTAASAGLQRGTIYDDYNVMLNQTNIGHNNNKFYKIQLVQTSAGYTLFTKWGRVGEAGKTQEQGPFSDINVATKEFSKKFKSKTANNWSDYRDDKDSFQSRKGKYTVVEMEQDDEAASAMAAAAMLVSGSNNKPVAASALESSTKELVDLIFDEDMFNSAMTAMNLDPKKLPLGALSQAQIAKGVAVLERLEDAINSDAKREELEDITSEFYTLIPHAFGRRSGPVLDTSQKVQEKFDMLNTLTDIETAQSMQKKRSSEGNENNDDDKETHQRNPSDLNYAQLTADLKLLDPTNDKDEYKLIETYFDDTKDNRGYGGAMTLKKVWKVNRHREDQRFANHNNIKERKLLWHGTNVAVVAAILKSGLRIMPHSGGRVGRGIYLADQHQKSAWYTQSARGKTIMFLVEAALGNPNEILQDDCTLTAAPTGYDSVLAKGQMEPPNAKDLEIDGKTVSVPQGKPKPVPEAKKSAFIHNEFLIYQESQHRIRYILTFDSR